MSLAVDGVVTGSISGDATINGIISSTQSVSGEITTDISGGVTEIYWADTLTDTFSTLQTAYQSGKQLMLRYGNIVYSLAKYGSDKFQFSAVLAGNTSNSSLGFAYISCTTTGWGNNYLRVVEEIHSIPSGGNTGDIMIKRSNDDYDAGWVAPANAVEQDNTLPITSAAVYTEVGNINALLATI